MKDIEVWELVDLPPDGKTIGHKWLFKKKTGMDGVDLRASTPAEIQCMQNIPYALAVGLIMYDVRCTRPDVAFAQNITSRFQQTLGDAHWTTVKNILKYLRNTKDMFLVYGGDTKRELRVSCYTDAGYLMDADDMRSQTGYVFILNVLDYICAESPEFPKQEVIDHVSKSHNASKTLTRYDYVDAYGRIKTVLDW
ncbi:hypothetical protein Tco_0491532 [Tanacetum coccineum]